ncbi:DNA cytosine methyltransferase [Acutalibacter caecimuris]|uniref:DNA cytosine methyltransferase n=1 Tax=Acutalibacter caecimuris TaxID=3093657 RepID=UPI002AC8F603|nr:DNA cytosine methyltransferase [Acutalibacter sp. M00118]
MPMEAIDLFAGCGGLSWGFLQAGWHMARAVELDGQAAATYAHNHPHAQVLAEDISQTVGLFRQGEAQAVIGGPPCQGFSMAGARIRRGFMDDPRNYLFRHYFQIVKTVRPLVFVMENVKGMATMQGGAIFREILRLFQDESALEGPAYRLHWQVVNAAGFGVPQKRERLILLGTTLSGVDFPALWEATRREIAQAQPGFFDPVTVRDAIGNLPAPAPNGLVPAPPPQTAYQRYLAGAGAMLSGHSRTNHSPLAVARMKQIPAGENYTVLKETIRSVHSGAYGRLQWDSPAPTVTTRFDTPAGGRFIHPVEDRTLTPREAARLQSFPDDFRFSGSKTAVCRQIGNAVPPKVAYFLGKLAQKAAGG